MSTGVGIVISSPYVLNSPRTSFQMKSIHRPEGVHQADGDVQTGKDCSSSNHANGAPAEPVLYEYSCPENQPN